jgi:hypothetical protein
MFMVQFGQPLVALYQDYFLGDPVRELVATTQGLVQEPGNDVPYRQLQRQYDGVRTLETVSDTDASNLRQSVVRIHRSVVNRLGSGNLASLNDNFSDSYTRLLNNRLIDNIFSRPDLVRERLKDDLNRLGRLPALPSHPARGLEAFWNSADTAGQIIESYGDIYANQVTCRQILSTHCGAIYDSSVQLSGQYIAQYFLNWPRFSRTLSNTPKQFLDRAPDLYDRYVSFDRNISGYLRAEPWKSLSDLNQGYKEFNSKYRNELQDWYGSMLDQVNLSVADFSARQWSTDFSSLNILRDVERLLERRVSLQELLLSQQNLNRRESVLNQIGGIYARVTARHHFDPNFKASTQGIRSLRETMNVFPGGENLQNRLSARLEEARTLQRSLNTALSRQNFASLLQGLSTLEDHLTTSEVKEPWNTLAKQFLSNSHEKLTNPDWQPTTDEPSEQYREIVQRFGELGRRLEIPELNQEWVDRTLLALKSRRFNQLKHQVKRRVSVLDDNSNLERIIQNLNEIRSLDNLPEKLSSQIPIIIFQSAVLERLRTNDTRLKDAFSSMIEANARFRTRWNQLSELLNGVRSDDARVTLSDELTSYVNRWGSWVQSIDQSSFGGLVQDQAVAVLRGHLERLFAELRETIENPGEDGTESTQRLSDLETLSSALDAASGIPGYERTYSLERWENVVRIRRQLVQLSATTSNLSKGNLWGRNAVYQRYQRLSESFEWQPFPSGYDASVEQELLRTIFQTIRTRSRQIEQAASDDWLPGWGGRITGEQVLEPWLNFIRNLRAQSTHPGMSATAKKLLQSTELLMEQLTDNNE